MEVLELQVLMARERAERAEPESECFAAMMDEIAKAAKLSDDAVSEIRAKVRAVREAENVYLQPAPSD